MSSKTLPLVLLGVATLIVLAIAFVNPNSIALTLFGLAVTVPEGLLLGGAYVLGVALTLPLLLTRIAVDGTSQQRLEQWQQQDTKLAQQVQSDKEKQLEAKIATLEAALQKALQKK